MNNQPPPKPADPLPRTVNENGAGGVTDPEFNRCIRILLLCFISWFFGSLTTSAISIITKKTYKDGQIDALTGQIKYELVTNIDSTRTWKCIERNENE